MASDLTRTAIADAKQVLEAARANAKLALQETFQPTLQRMISTKLREEDDEFAEDDDFNIDISVPGTEPAEEEAPMDDMGDDEGGQGFDSFDDEETEDEPAPEEGDEDLEMENLMRELEGMDEPTDGADEFMDEGEEEEWQDPVPDGSDEGMLETLLHELMDDEEPLDENEDGGGAFEDNAPIKQMNHETRKLRNENTKLKKDLNEALRAITTYKRTINEVNLINAKLLYTTKIFRNEGLNQNQKLRILESFDKTHTIREAKLVYATIMQSLNKKALPQPAQKRKVQEGLASKSIKAINPKGNINENANVLRWKQLAGLAKISY